MKLKKGTKVIARISNYRGGFREVEGVWQDQYVYKGVSYNTVVIPQGTTSEVTFGVPDANIVCVPGLDPNPAKVSRYVRSLETLESRYNAIVQSGTSDPKQLAKLVEYEKKIALRKEQISSLCE